MFNKKKTWFKKQGKKYISEYQDILNNADIQGYVTPSDRVQILQDILIQNLKLDGVWNLLDELYIMTDDIADGTDYEFNMINWKNPTDELTVNDTIQTLKDAGDVKIDMDTVEHFTSPYSQNSTERQWTKDDLSFGYQGVPAGAFNTQSSFIRTEGESLIWIRQTSPARCYVNNTSYKTLSVSNSVAMGVPYFRLYSRNSSDDLSYYEQGLLYSSTTAATALEMLDVPVKYFIGTTDTTSTLNIKILFAGYSLTAQNVLDFYTSFQTYLNSL